MSVDIEFINFIVRRKALDQLQPGFSEELIDQDNVPSNFYDENMIRYGAMNPVDLNLLVDRFRGLGIERSGASVTAIKMNDYCVVDTSSPDARPCNWLSVDSRRAYYFEPKVFPNFIRSKKIENYTNIFHLIPNCQNLYGTETLYGNWDGKILLLAKDGAPTGAILDLINSPERDIAWRHAERGRDSAGYKTNDYIRNQLKTYGSEKYVLYGSICANMLFDKKGWSRSLPGIKSGPLHDYLKEVLLWVIQNMPNLETIGCLGSESWYIVMSAARMQTNIKEYKKHRDEEKVINATFGEKYIRVIGMYHPAARKSSKEKELGWSLLNLI